MYINLFPPQILNFFGFQWFSKQFTQDYLSNYAIEGEAIKVKVFYKDYDELDVILKIVKDGRAVITKGWTKVVKAIHMKEGSIWAFRFSNFDDNQKLFRLCLYRLKTCSVVNCCNACACMLLYM